jgi:hypothetical protein
MEQTKGKRPHKPRGHRAGTRVPVASLKVPVSPDSFVIRVQNNHPQERKKEMMKSRSVAAVVLFGWTLLFASVGGIQAEQQREAQHTHSDPDQNAGMNADKQAMYDIYENYLAIQTALANDSMVGVSDRAKALAEATREFNKTSAGTQSDDRHAELHARIADAETVARSLAKEKDISAVRDDFAELSEILVELHKTGRSDDTPQAHAFVCDMAKRVWLQKDEKPSNPYYGAVMLRCGRKLH